MRSLPFDDHNTVFISDTHFSHESIMRMSGRPFADADEMDAFMISCWNAVVGPRTHVWHLGDFGFGPIVRQKALFDRLRGIKHLITGNHDKETVASAEFGWASVDQIRVLKSGETKVVLCHYPMSEWPDFFHGAVHLHGHTHDNIPSSSRRWDCGVDHQGWTPLRLSEIQLRMAELPDLDFRTGVPATPELDPLAAVEDDEDTTFKL